MARVILGSYMVRYPLGGMMSWVLQWLVGLQRLGHDVYFVEKAGYPNACYDPVRDVMSDDCRAGFQITTDLLARFDLDAKACFVDVADTYYGLTREQIEAVFDSADLFIDMGTHGSWLPQATRTGIRVMVDGEPAFTQLKMATRQAAGESLAVYDRYYTTGQNIGTPRSPAPTADREWRHVFHPVVTELFADVGPPPRSVREPAFTTVMNWQSYQPVAYEGITYYHKDIEFDRFATLPSRTDVPLEVAVSGVEVPWTELRDAGWRVRDAHEVTSSYDRFVDYIRESRAEFSVCKNGYVVSRSGWFSDRSAAYLAAGRPVILQDTGYSVHLPCGEGLVAFSTFEEAVDAVDRVHFDHERHSRTAVAIARDVLDADVVLARFLAELGL